MSDETRSGRVEKIVCESIWGERMLTLSLPERDTSDAETFLESLISRSTMLRGTIAVTGDNAEWIAPVLAASCGELCRVVCVARREDALQFRIALENSGEAPYTIIDAGELRSFVKREGNLSHIVCCDGLLDAESPFLAAATLNPGGKVWLPPKIDDRISPDVRHLQEGARAAFKRLGFSLLRSDGLDAFHHCHPLLMREFLSHLERHPWRERLQEIDLTPRGDAGEQRLRVRVFCETLRHVEQEHCLPYHEAPGLRMVRHHVARWVRAQQQIFVSAKNVFVGPSRSALHELLLAVCEPFSLFELPAQADASVKSFWEEEQGLPKIVLGETPTAKWPGASLAFLLCRDARVWNTLLEKVEGHWARVAVTQQIAARAVLEENFGERSPFSGQSRSLPSAAPSAKEAGDSRSQENGSPEKPPIELGVAENLFPAPPQSLDALAFAALESTGDSHEIRERVMKNARIALGFPSQHPGALGLGVTPLFRAVATECAHQKGTMYFPQGVYGDFPHVATAVGCHFEFLPTLQENGFRLTRTEMALVPHPNAWFFVNWPTTNPSGASYSGEELDEMLTLARGRGQRLVLDTVFLGTELEGAPESMRPGDFRRGSEAVWLHSFSKCFSLGGLRFGIALTEDPALAQAIRSGAGTLPDQATLAVADRLYLALAEGSLAQHRNEQRRAFSERARFLCAALEECGWSPLPPQGGLTLLASPPPAWSTLTSTDSPDVADAAAAILEERFGIKVRGPRWHGVPGHCRFVFSVPDPILRSAAEALQKAAHSLPS